MKFPFHITRHHAAQDAGQFSPYYEPMKHIQPIITNARQGRPLSTANRKRRNAWPFILTGCILFWALVALAFLA